MVKARCARRRYFFWLVTGPVSVAQALVKVPTLAPGPLRINRFATSPLNTRPQTEKNTTLAKELPIHWGIHHLRSFVQLAISVSPRSSSSTHQTSSLSSISSIFHLSNVSPACSLSSFLLLSSHVLVTFRGRVLTDPLFSPQCEFFLCIYRILHF